MTGMDAPALAAAMRLLLGRLERHRSELNRLNVYPVPDGDTGDNLLATLTVVVQALSGRTAHPDVVEAIARGALLGGRGSSGVIVGQALIGFVRELPDPCGPAAFASALAAAAGKARAAVADPVEGTILTVAADAARQARETASASGTLEEVVRAAAEEGRRSLARTPDLLPALARAGVVDAGGLGYVLFLDALAEALTGVVNPPIVLAAPVLQAVASEREEGGRPVGPRYEVLCLLAADDGQVGSLRERWLALGDTVAIAGGEGTWRCHVHTDDVVGALAAARGTGAVSDVEVTDLRQQVAAEPGLRGGAAGEHVFLVAVAEGDGLVAAYLEAGVDRVVVGGATSKPSTGDLLRVLDACPGPVVLLTGDKDVVPAAERAVELSARPSWLVPADMLAGLGALETVGSDSDPEECARRLTEASGAAVTVRVQRAVRDTVTDLGPVQVGEWLAMSHDGPVATAPTADEALLAAAAAVVGPTATSAVLALDAEAGGDDVVGRLRQAYPHVAWRVLRANRGASAYGLAVR